MQREIRALKENRMSDFKKHQLSRQNKKDDQLFFTEIRRDMDKEEQQMFVFEKVQQLNHIDQSPLYDIQVKLPRTFCDRRLQTRCNIQRKELEAQILVATENISEELVLGMEEADMETRVEGNAHSKVDHLKDDSSAMEVVGDQLSL